MNPQELRLLQAPLKERYRKDPATALMKFKSQGRLSERISCEIDSKNGLIKAGLHPFAGGDGSLACSADMLLEALIACAGVTLGAVSMSMGIQIMDCLITAEGDIDFRGTMGVSRDVPVGFKSITLTFDIDCNATDEQMQTLAKLTERYCIVFQTLITATGVHSIFKKK